MRLFLSLILLTIGAAGLSACHTHHHSGHPHANGDFCPPGHAKKGHC